MFRTALCTIAKVQKQPKCPSTDEWIKMCYIHNHTHTDTLTHTHRRMLFSHKNKEMLPFAITQINLEGVMISEIHQRKTNTVCYYLCGLKKIKLINITKKPRLTDIENKAVVTSGDREVGRGNSRVGN